MMNWHPIWGEFSHLELIVARTSSGSTTTLIRRNRLLKMNELMLYCGVFYVFPKGGVSELIVLYNQ